MWCRTALQVMGRAYRFVWEGSSVYALSVFLRASTLQQVHLPFRIIGTWWKCIFTGILVVKMYPGYVCKAVARKMATIPPTTPLSCHKFFSGQSPATRLSSGAGCTSKYIIIYVLVSIFLFILPIFSLYNPYITLV